MYFTMQLSNQSTHTKILLERWSRDYCVKSIKTKSGGEKGEEKNSYIHSIYTHTQTYTVYIYIKYIRSTILHNIYKYISHTCVHIYIYEEEIGALRGCLSLLLAHFKLLVKWSIGVWEIRLFGK